MRRQEILGEDDELRAEHGGEHAARQHPGHDLRTVRIARRIGRGEAVGLVRRRVEPAAERADEQHPEIAVHHCRV
jgi:hypothetical protein